MTLGGSKGNFSSFPLGKKISLKFPKTLKPPPDPNPKSYLIPTPHASTKESQTWERWDRTRLTECVA